MRSEGGERGAEPCRSRPSCPREREIVIASFKSIRTVHSLRRSQNLRGLFWGFIPPRALPPPMWASSTSTTARQRRAGKMNYWVYFDPFMGSDLLHLDQAISTDTRRSCRGMATGRRLQFPINSRSRQTEVAIASISISITPWVPHRRSDGDSIAT